MSPVYEMKTENAVEWHSQNAASFDNKYSHSRDFIERFEVWTQVIDRYSDPQYRVLDVGCGSGVFSFYAAERNASVVGVDGSREMIELCDRKKNSLASNLTFISADMSSLSSVVRTKANLILCSSVLEYLDNLDSSLRAIVSMLDINGVVVFSMPNRASVFRAVEPVLYRLTGRPRYYRYVKNTFTVSELSKKLTAYGLDIRETAYFARTPILSSLCHRFGAQRFSDNLFIMVAQKKGC